MTRRLSLLAVLLCASPSARAQDEIRVVREFRPGPPVPGPTPVAGVHSGRPVFETPAGDFAFDPETGVGSWVGAWSEVAVRDGDSTWFLTPEGLWVADDRPETARLLARTPRDGGFFAVDRAAGKTFVLASRGDGLRLLVLEDGGLRDRTPPGVEIVVPSSWRPGHRFAADGGLWLVTEPDGELLRVDAEAEVVRRWPLGAPHPGVVRVTAVNDRVVVHDVRGVFRVDDDRLVPLFADPTTPQVVRPRPLDRVVTERHLWVRFTDEVVVTDGTAAGTRTFADSGPIEAALGEAFVTALDPGRGLEILGSSGQVEAFVPQGRNAVSTGRALLVLAAEGEDAPEAPFRWGLYRFGATRQLDRVQTLTSPPLRPPPSRGLSAGPPRLGARASGGAWIIERRPEAGARCHRFDADGRSVGPPLDVPWTALEPGAVGDPWSWSDLPFPRPFAALPGGEVVVDPEADRFLRPGRLAVVDPATGEIGFEVEAVGGASFDGRALYFERAGRPPEGGNELVRWTPAEGVQRLRTVELRTWVAAGHEGRPLLVRHGEAPRFLQLDARDAFQPVAPELDPEATCGWQVGERALWWMICDEDAWTLWSAPFEAGEPSIVGTSWPGSGSRPDLSWQVREGLVELYGAPFVPVGDRLELIDGLRVADGSARGPYGGRLEVARLGERRLLAATDTPRWRDDGPAFEATPPFASVPDWVGRELWVLDPVGNAGAAPTPRLVKDLFPGAQGSDPRALTAVPGSDRIVFHARTPDAGRELWVSDGTPDGTRPLCDLGAGRAPGVPEAATIRIGPDALFVTAFVPDVGTEVVAVPLAVVKGDAPCRGFEGAAPDLLTEADAGCGCRSTSGSTSPETLLLGVLLVAWLVRRAGRVRAARL